MKLFYYRATDGEHNLTTGSLSSRDRKTAVAELKRRGLFPLSVKTRSVLFSNIKDVLSAGKPLSPATLHNLASRLYIMSDSGLDMQKTLSIVTRQSKKDRQLYEALQQITQKVGSGAPLPQALKNSRKFPDFFVSMVEIGLKSGNLPEIFAELARYYEWEDKSLNEVKSALTYPAIVSLLLIGTIIGALNFVIPAYAGIFSSNGIVLPFATRLLISASDFFKEHIRLITGMIMFFIAAVGVFLSRPKGKAALECLKLNAPLIKNIYVTLLNYRLASAARLLLMSGAPVTAALEYTFNALDAPYLKKRLESVLSDIAKGFGVAESFKKVRYFNETLISMVETGEETGRLPYMLDKSAGYFKNELENAVKGFSVMVEPVMTIVLGVIICLVLMALVLPTFSLAGAL